MNGLEKRYATYLDGLRLGGLIFDYWFDAVKLRLAEKTFYTPDFLVLKADETIEIHEVKGSSRNSKTGEATPFVEDDAAVKIKVAADKFPFKFIMVWFDKNQGWVHREY